MNEAVAHDMNVSAWLFRERVWPLLRPELGGGELLAVEHVPDNKIAQALDARAGIDYLQVHPQRGVRGIASRVQTDNKDWGTFTLRQSRITGATTEIEKINFAIDPPGRWLHPNIHVQAYAKSAYGPIISIGYVRTVELFWFVNQGNCCENGVHNARFVYCHWDALMRAGVRVGIIRPTTEEQYSW